MNEELIKKIQVAVGVKADGDLGPVTLQAIANKLGIVQDKNKLIEVALKEVGINETSKNHGKGIAKYWTATSYPDGYANREPYCAAAVCWMIREAGILPDSKQPRTASAFGFETHATKHGLKLIKAPSSVKKGDLVIFTFSHIGIAITDSDAKGSFQTVEANTSSNEQGSQRDGGGVWKRSRNLSSVRSVVRL